VPGISTERVDRPSELIDTRAPGTPIENPIERLLMLSLTPGAILIVRRNRNEPTLPIVPSERRAVKTF
jgi:hypothetical protein